MIDTLMVLSGVLFVAGFVPYIHAIVRKETEKVKPIEPSKASWIIWAILDTISIAAMIAKGSLNGQIVGAVLGAWVIVVLTFKYGKSGWTKLDVFCLGGAALGIVLWVVTSNPLFGLVTSLSVVFIGAVPTFVSAWKDPSKEDKLAWTLFFISCVCATIAIPDWNQVAHVVQPLTFLIIETIMMYILYVRPRISK